MIRNWEISLCYEYEISLSLCYETSLSLAKGREEDGRREREGEEEEIEGETNRIRLCYLFL
jgi:hypothetical protein